MPRQFSTGISQLDAYIGGVRQGDAFFCIAERTRYLQPVVNALTGYCRKTGIPIVTVLASSSGFFHHFELLSKTSLRAYEVAAPRKHPAQLVRSLLLSLRKHARRACIILDGGSSWKNLLGTEQQYAEFFRKMVELSAQNKCLLFTSVQRSEFSPGTISQLKDSATVSLELIERQGALYCVALVTVGRYVPYRLFPLNIRIRHTSLGRFIGAPPDAYPEKFAQRLFADIDSDLFSSDNQYRRLFEETAEPMALIHAETGLKRINQALSEMTGYAAEEVNTMPLTSVVSPNDVKPLLRTVVDRGKKRHFVLRFDLLTKMGKSLPVEVRCSYIGSGWYLCIVEDLRTRQTERELQRALEVTRKSEETFRRIVDGFPHATAIFLSDKLLYANSAFVHLLRFPAGMMPEGKNIFDIVASEDVPKVKKLFRLLKTQSLASTDLLVQTMDGDKIFCSCNFSKIDYYGKHAVHLVMTDVSGVRKTIDDLRKRYEQSTFLLQHSHDAIGVLEQGRFVFVNAAFLNLFGYSRPEEILSKELSTILLSAHRKKFQRRLEAIEGDEKITFVCSGICKDSSAIDVELVAERAIYNGKSAIVIHFSDISAKKLLEQELEDFRLESTIISKSLSLLQQFAAAAESTAMNNVLSGLLPELRFRGGGMYILDEVRREFRLVYHSNFPEPLHTALGFLPQDEGLAGLIMKTQEPHIFSISSYPSYLPYRATFAENGIREIGLIPLVVDGRVIGILVLLSQNEMHERMPLRVYGILGKLLGSAIDTMYRQRTLEETLLQRETLLESLPHVVYSRTVDGRFLYIGPGIETLTGYAPKDFMRNRSLWLSIVHPDDKKDLLIQSANLNTLPNTVTNEYRILPKGKAEYRRVRDSFFLVRGDANEITQINGIVAEVQVSQGQQHDGGLDEETMSA